MNGSTKEIVSILFFLARLFFRVDSRLFIKAEMIVLRSHFNFMKHISMSLSHRLRACTEQIAHAIRTKKERNGEREKKDST